MHPPISRPFHEAWSLAQTRQSIHAAIKVLKRSVDVFKEPDKQSREVDAQLDKAVLGHLLHLAQAGRLVRPANTEGLELDFVAAWDAIIAGGEDRHNALAYTFAPALRREFWKAQSEEEAPAIHAKVLALMGTGDFGFRDTEVVPCHATGERIKLAMRAWKPYLGLFQPDTGWQLLTPGQFAPAGIEHIVLPVPSGELLIHDRFNVGSFQETLEAIPGYDQLPSLGTAVGRVLRAKTACLHLGVATVWVGDVGPNVVAHEGRLLMGFVGEESTDPEQTVRHQQSLGSIHQGVWSTHMADKQVLIDILARTTDLAQAQSAVEAYIQCEKVLTVQVVPGEHHLYFAADPTVFKKKFASQEVNFAGFQQPMMVLSPTPLTLTDPAPKLSRKPGF